MLRTIGVADHFPAQGCQILKIAVADGLEVLELLGNTKATVPDVIVSDALMPRMDGFQLCRTLRQHPRWCRLP